MCKSQEKQVAKKEPKTKPAITRKSLSAKKLPDPTGASKPSTRSSNAKLPKQNKLIKEETEKQLQPNILIIDNTVNTLEDLSINSYLMECSLAG